VQEYVPRRDSLAQMAESARARQVGEACEKIGFFMVVNHRVRDTVYRSWLWKALEAALPVDQFCTG
jgi:hypothetical protein